MSASKVMECSCNQPGSFFSYTFSDGEKDIFKSTLALVIDRETDKIYKCTLCGTVWYAAAIHGGGIYGDVDWTNISLPHWHDHWYWKRAESDNFK